MRMKWLLEMAVWSLCIGIAAAADNNPAFTNAAEAGPDFVFQGEYVGSVDDRPWGVQVVALGDGKFDSVGFRGGLPGEGWRRGDATRLGTGARKDGAVEIQGDTWTAMIKDGLMTVMHDGIKIGELKKMERKSPTLGAKPPAGAIVLFDGSTPDNF
jgi:hypothetical protein